MESNSFVYESSVERPAVSRVNSPKQATSSTPAVIVQTRRGRGAIRLPTFDHRPVVLGSAEPNAGRLGQNIQRPKITSRAGSRVTITRNVTAIPTARTGP